MAELAAEPGGTWPGGAGPGGTGPGGTGPGGTGPGGTGPGGTGPGGTGPGGTGPGGTGPGGTGPGGTGPEAAVPGSGDFVPVATGDAARPRRGLVIGSAVAVSAVVIAVVFLAFPSVGDSLGLSKLHTGSSLGAGSTPGTGISHARAH